MWWIPFWIPHPGRMPCMDVCISDNVNSSLGCLWQSRWELETTLRRNIKILTMKDIMFGLSHSETCRTEEAKAHAKRNPRSSHCMVSFPTRWYPTPWHMLKVCLLGVACVFTVTGAWRGICAWKWVERQDKLVVLHSSEGLLSRTVTKTVAWDVRHITQTVFADISGSRAATRVGYEITLPS